MNRRVLVVGVVLLAASLPLRATDFTRQEALPDAALDQVRGGMDLGNDVLASLSLQRTVLVNGMEVIQNSVSIPDIAHITTDQATALSDALRATTITTGIGGVSTDLGSSSGALVIQNSLNNQAISATTSIDASVNSARMLQNLRLGEAIQDATIQFRGN